MSAEVDKIRVKIAKLGQLMYDRRLTDSAGGNISVRMGNLIYITPRYAGARFRWRLRREQVLICDLEGNQLEGDGEISREAKVHLKLYKEFPDGNAIVHGHAQNVLVFCAARRPIPPVLADVLKFGEIEVCKYAPAHSNELSKYVVEKFRGKEACIKKQAAAVLAPWHGIFVLGKDIDAAFDALERIDGNARVILLSKLLPDDDGLGVLGAQVEALKAVTDSFKK